jgi:hypothetical protein
MSILMNKVPLETSEMIFHKEHQMTSKMTLLIKAEDYQRRGMPLPLDLYSALLGLGIDASLYNQQPKAHQQDIDFGGAEEYDAAADLLAQEINQIDRELSSLGEDFADESL